MKLTFERAILIVLIVIIFLSTSEIRGRYKDIIIDKFSKKDIAASADILGGNAGSFPSLLDANKKYSQGDYEGAARDYLALTLNATLSIEQKANANFRLAMCQFYLNNYQRAFDGFVKTAGFSPNDSVIYNNAAVSAYRAKDMKSAIEYETKALAIRPAVEYYYNLARMYEDNGQYDMAVNNYVAVAKAEQNLTETDKIDPVRVKEKVARLMSNSQSSVSNDMIIGLKLKDANYEVLTINENEMQIKSSDFTAKVENQNGSKTIVAEYDRKKNDPYNLVSEIAWTVYKNGKQIYKKVNDKIDINASESGNYEVRLSLKYNDKVTVSTKMVNINNNQSTIDKGKQDEIIVKHPADEYVKTYVQSIYEQLFEKNFDIGSNGYTDHFSVLWGKDNGVKLEFNNKTSIDKSSSLVVQNKSNSEAGVWANFDSLIKEKRINDEMIRISFFGRKISDFGNVEMKIRVKSQNMIAVTQKTFSLDNRWEQKSINVFIPKDATGLTVSISTPPNEEYNIDGFIIIGNAK